MTWYDGGKLPPKELFQGEKLVTHDGGSLAIRTKGTLFTRTWHGGDSPGNMFLLLPQKTFADFVPPEPTLPRTPGHHREWVDACRGQAMPLSNFAYASVTRPCRSSAVPSSRNRFSCARRASAT